VAVLGRPGSGKTTLLAQLTHRLREQGRPVVFVSAQHADDAAQVLQVVRQGARRHRSGAETIRDAGGSPPTLSVRRSLAHLAIPADEPTVVVLDDISAQAGTSCSGDFATSFGRRRSVG